MRPRLASASMAMSVIAALAIASIPQSAQASTFPATEVKPGVVYACVTEKTGWMRVPKQKELDGKTVVQCRRTEKLRYWGMSGGQGQTGETGAAGPQGPQGPAGPAGPAGPGGATGATGAQGPAGPAGQDGSDAVPGVIATYKTPSPSNDISVTSTPTTVLSLDVQTDGYYLVSFRAGVETSNPVSEIMNCMLTGGIMNGAFLNAGDTTNNPTLVFSPKGTVSGTFPVQVNLAQRATTTLSISCVTTTLGTVSERSITATPISTPTFRF